MDNPPNGKGQMTGIYEAYPNSCDTPSNRGASNTDRSTWAAAKASVAADESRSPQEREDAAKNAVALCPQCREPIGDEVAEEGDAVGSAPTFVLAARSEAEEATVAGASSSPRGGGRGGRGRRGGRRRATGAA